MPKTLFELEERLADMNAQISQEADALVQMASDAGAKMEDIRQKKTRVESLKERAALLENEVAQMMQAAKEKLHGGAGAVMSRQEAAGLFCRRFPPAWQALTGAVEGPESGALHPARLYTPRLLRLHPAFAPVLIAAGRVLFHIP